MIKEKREKHSCIRIGFCIALILAFLGLSGCGCLMPDVPCVPGVRQSLCKGIKK